MIHDPILELQSRFVRKNQIIALIDQIMSKDWVLLRLFIEFRPKYFIWKILRFLWNPPIEGPTYECIEYTKYISWKEQGQQVKHYNQDMGENWSNHYNIFFCWIIYFFH